MGELLSDQDPVKEWLPKIAEALGGRVDNYSPVVEFKIPDGVVQIAFFGESPSVLVLGENSIVRGRQDFALRSPDEVITDPKMEL